MKLEEACDAIIFRGDAVHPGEGEHDLRILSAKVVCRLPDDVREWLLDDTTHIFIGGHGQLGEFIDLYFPPREYQDGLIKFRIIFISEQVMRLPEDEALWIVAHEIAHSRLNHDSGNRAAEDEADGLAKEWGFTAPPDRSEILNEKYGRAE
jgi:hypothetical protein